MIRRSALTTALGLSLSLLSVSAFAQSNVTGSIFGQVPADAGTSIVVRNIDTGFERSVQLDNGGRYRLGSLPTGEYTVKLMKDGQTVSTRENVVVSIAGGSEVSFGGAGGSADATSLDRITVVGTGAAALDVSSVDTRTVFYANDLAKLPVPRDVAGVALLAPSVVNNTSYAGAPSFGGSASSENAYYINGYAVTNPLTSIGFTTLPFEGIDQMQVLTGGYGAEFGRSTGGVINTTTKRGTNTWEGGVALFWTPESLRSDPVDQPYPDTGYFGQDNPDTTKRTDGTLYAYRKENKSWNLTYGAYVGGPIIEDKLFFYAAGEISKRQGTSVGSVITSPASPTGFNTYKYKMPRWMAKVDWQISDNHLLELTAVSDTTEYDPKLSGFNYADFSHDEKRAGGSSTVDGGELYIGKYTGYITDNLTISALYGQQTINHDTNLFNFDPTCPRLSGNLSAANQRPGYVYNRTCQFSATTTVDGAFDETKGGRFDIEYAMGDHTFRAGYDETEAHSFTGSEYAGGFVWVFQNTANKNNPIDASHGVGSPASAGGSGLGVAGSNKGYFARRQYYTQLADVKVNQKAQYIEDRWQIADNFLLSLGLRNEQFTNYNGDGVPYIEQNNQLAPRIGAAWDVRGDSTLKVFANAGRYHLALPNNVAVRGAASSLYTQEYFTYTGTDPRTGAPTGLVNVPVDASLGYTCPGNNFAISANLECGTAPDPRTVAAKDIESHYQDEYILGMQHVLNDSLNWGVKGTYRTLRSAIDDTCTPALDGGCFLFNPGVANTFQIDQGDGTFETVSLSAEELGFDKLKRDYFAIDLYAEHPLANNWYGKLEYTFSKNYGNTEGQLASDLDTGAGGQTDVSVTQDWDLPQLMVGANGLLPNHRAHQVKGFGYYQFTPEWRVGATGILSSGRPRSCTSFYPTADAGLYNGSYYHYCGLAGSGTTPGSAGYVAPSADYAFSPRGSLGTTPWTYSLNLNVAYNPAWAKGLTLQADVFNVLDQQKPQAYIQGHASDRVTRSQFYGQELNYTAPRSVRLTARYDF